MTIDLTHLNLFPHLESGFILIAISVLLPIVATIQGFKTFKGLELPVWCILIWVVSIVGPIIALIYINCIYKNTSKLESGSKSPDFERFLSEEPHRKYLSKKEKEDLFAQWKANQDS